MQLHNIPIELSKIAPLWYERLTTTEDYDSLWDPLYHTSIFHPMQCVVGEAHGMSDRYLEDGKDHCQSCVNYSLEIIECLDNRNNDAITLYIREFTKHWGFKHATATK